MAKRLTDYMIKKETDYHMIQAKLERSLVETAKAQLTKDGLTWADLLRAALKKYIDESKGK